MTKIQITLTDQETNAIQLIGARYGYNLAKTLKFLVSRETTQIIDDSYLPTFSITQANENHAINAISDHRNNKTVRLEKPSDIGLL